MKVDMRITGLNELMAKLRSANEKVANKAMRRAINRGAIIVRDRIRSNITAVQSGALKGSIAIRRKAKRTRLSGQRFTAVIGPRRKWGKEYGGKLREPSRYAHLIEFGHTTKGGGTVPAQPFMRPGLAAAQAEVVEVQIREMRAAEETLRA